MSETRSSCNCCRSNLLSTSSLTRRSRFRSSNITNTVIQESVIVARRSTPSTFASAAAAASPLSTNIWRRRPRLLLVSLLFFGATSRNLCHYYTSYNKLYYRCHAMSTTTSTTIPNLRSPRVAPPPKKIAVAQVCSTSSKWKNLIHVAMCAGWSISSTRNTTPSTSDKTSKNNDNDNPCTMLFLPECFGFLGSNVEETIRAAELLTKTETTTTVSDPKDSSHNSQYVYPKNPDIVNQGLIQIIQECSRLPINVVPKSIPSLPMNLNHPSSSSSSSSWNEWDISLIDGLRIIAQTTNLWISAGSIHVLCPPTTGSTDTTKKVYNTHVMMDPTGTIRSTYNKIHLFDVSIPEQNVDLRESNSTQPGQSLVVCTDTPIGNIGLSVCYDLRFPEIYTQLVQTMQAQIIVVPSAFTVPTGHAHWHTLLRARAIENQCYVIAAAQYGQHNEKRASYGHSLIVDGWGTIVEDAGGMDSTVQPSDQQPKIITCNIDLSTIHSIRQRMPIQQHRANAPNFLISPPS